MNRTFSFTGLKHQVLSVLTLIIMSFAFMQPCTAQMRDQQRISREQLAETQAKHIAKELGLKKDKKKRYIDTYVRYQKEVWALGPRERRVRSKDRNHRLTDAQLKARQEQRFNRNQQVLNLREKYYKEYIQFLTPSQIEKSYQLERDMMQRLAKKRAGK